MVIPDSSSFIKMSRVVVLLSTLSVAAIPARGQPKDWLVPYGDGFRFGVKEPAGWVGDWSRASSLKSNIIFYPKGHNMHSVYGVIRVRVGRKEDENAGRALAAEVERCREKFPGIEFVDLEVTHPQYPCFAKLFLIEGTSHEYAAYLNPGPGYWYMFTVAMNTGQAAATESELAAFQTVARSLLAMDAAGPPEEGATEFEIALKAADDNLKSKKGERYDADFGRAAGPWLAKAMSRCIKGLPDSELGLFTVLIKVGTDGRAEEVLARPMTGMAKCLKPLFVSARHPKPPGPSWWVKMEVATVR
jgi:hypothetical protein